MSGDLEEMKDNLRHKRAANSELKNTIQANEVQIEDINTEIQNLNEEIESLKRRNDSGLQ